MTEQTDAAEIGPYVGRSIDEVIYDYVMVRGDLTEPYAREQLARIIAAREAAARAEALREAAEAAVPMFNMHPSNRTNTVADWLRARAARIARTDGAGS